MVNEPLVIVVDPASELARALAGMEAPIVLAVDGVRYTVDREDAVSRYDTRAILDGLRRSRGALRGVDTEVLLADLDEQRTQDPSRHAS